MAVSHQRQQRAVDAAVVLLLALLTIVTYAPVLSFDFVDWDDPMYVTENPMVQDGLTWDGVLYALTTFDTGNWTPLTWLSLELDATLFGAGPAGFHATNVFWHTANTCLVYVVLRRLTGVVGGSLAVAVFFAVHPLHVESVAWVSERRDVLSTFWLLIALLAYAAYTQQPTRGRMAVVGVAMALGLLAKSMLVTLPVLLLLLDVWPLRRIAGNCEAGDSAGPLCTWPELIVEKWALFVLAILVGLITILAQQSAILFSGGKSAPALIRIGNAIHSYGWYLWKTVWPTGLCAHYPHPLSTLSWWEVGASAIVLGAVSVWAWTGRRDQPYRLVGWLWFLVALLPVIGLLQVGGQAHADRYAYVPHIGLFLMMAWEVDQCMAAFARTAETESVASAQRRIRSWLPIGLTACLAGASAWVAREQMETWRNSDALWARALQSDPEHSVAHLQLAQRDLLAGDLDDAEARFRRVLFRQPQDFKPVLGLAQIHERRGNRDQAAGHYAWALRLNPKDQFAAYRFAQLRPGQPLSIDVTRPEPKPAARSSFRAGLLSYDSGRTAAALQRFLEAVGLDPNFADAHYNAAVALQELGRSSEARAHFEAAVALVPHSPVFHLELAELLEAIGEKTLAREHFEAVQRLSPSDPEPVFRIERLNRL
jgi:tetratricopeptide (TPR) repeat protein